MIRYWVGVVSRDRVLDGLDLGIAQVNRGAREPVERLGEADGFVYYSPRESYPDGQLLRAFTAIGRVADAAPYQGRVGEWRPWRRRMDWDLGAVDAPIRPLVPVLDFTRDSLEWGRKLAPGLLEITRDDFEVLRPAMRRGAPEPSRRVIRGGSGPWTPVASDRDLLR